MTESLIGPLVGTYTLEQQIVEKYRVWAFEYLREIERKETLPARALGRPGTPESFHGGLDFTEWKADELPKLIVIVEPSGTVERDASTDPYENEHGEPEGRGGYTQTYEVRVGCIVRALGAGTIAQPSPLPEDEARAIASGWGAMSMLLVDQPPALASDIHMVDAPRLSYPNPDERTVVQSTATFWVTVTPIKLLSAGPTSLLPKESPEWQGQEEPWKQEPVVSTTKLTVAKK